MSGKENIIREILSGTSKKCEEIKQAAKSDYDSLIEKTKQSATDTLLSAKKQAEKDKEETVSRRIAVARLDAQKYLLSEKRKLLDEVYAKVEDAIKSDKKKYLALMTSLIRENAEKGDNVVIAKADRELLTQSYLDGFNLNLKLSTQYGAFSGGVLLTSSLCDKDLTLEALMRELREDTEIDVADILFEGLK